MMAEKNLIILNTVIVTPLGNRALKGEEMNRLAVVSDASIVIENGIIVYCGKAKEVPQKYMKANFKIVDAEGRVSMPGFVDSHTHLTFGGYRPDEFAERLKGRTYMEIMENGGGIQSTVNATRNAHFSELLAKSEWFIDRAVEMGVTTVEVKTGYGLDFESESKMLDVIGSIASNPNRKLNVVSTFLGAHAVPSEYCGRTEKYVDYIINEMLPAFKEKARFCDIFTEKNVFEIEDSRRLLKAAKNLGYGLKIHADEIVALGGAELAVELGAVSADHLLHVRDKGIEALSASETVATLLPLTAFSLKESFAPARKLIDAGCAVALATDLNPGSCFSGSIPLTIALACIHMDMTVEETITALTLNGAAALDMADETGSLEKGKRGDVVILDFDNYNMLPYYVGMSCVRTTVSDGLVVFDRMKNNY